MASSQSQVKEKEKRTVNAIWTSDQENIYIDILVEKVKRGEMTTSTFSKQTWKDIEKEFSNQSGIAYDLIQLKNKFNKLRQRYKNFKSLINHTGGGYDPNTHNVTADDETWEDYIKINPDAKHFRTKGCPEYSKLCVINGDTTATGSKAWYINQDMNIHQTSFPIEENNDSSDDVYETQQRSISNTRTCKHRRSLTGAETIADAILAYGKAKHAKTEFSSVPMDDPCMVKCMMILNEMAETDSIPVEKVVKAAVQFKEPSTRQMFRLMNPTTRKFWVESLE